MQRLFFISLGFVIGIVMSVILLTCVSFAEETGPIGPITIDSEVKQFDYVCIKAGADYYIENAENAQTYAEFTTLKFETLINKQCFAVNYGRYSVTFGKQYFENVYPAISTVVMIMEVNLTKLPVNLNVDVAKILTDNDLYVILFREAVDGDYIRLLGEGI